MFQGYGLSEATPVISTNSPKHHWHRFGSSGKILIPLDLKILDEEGRVVPRGQKGEIVVRGENVMAGYWKNPEATAETVRDGWLHTGDMGYVSEDDFLYVLGRFKSLLIASDGEKYSPEGMEEAIVDKSPYIDQIIVHNNQSPFTGAIVVPNREALCRELEARRTPEAEPQTSQRRFSAPRSTVTAPEEPMPGSFRNGGCLRDWPLSTRLSRSRTDW